MEIGLDIHEIHLHSKSSEPIEIGTVLPDEPGIYRDGKYGVHWRQIFVITETGCEVMTLAPKRANCNLKIVNLYDKIKENLFLKN